jgi:hypothetical protein
MRRTLVLFASLVLLGGAADARAGSIFVDYQITGGTISPALGLPVAATGGTFRVRFGDAIGPNTFSFHPYPTTGFDLSLLTFNGIGAGQNLQQIGGAPGDYFTTGRAHFSSSPNGPASWRTGAALSELWPRVAASMSLYPIFGAVRFRGFLTFRPRTGELSEYYGGFNVLGQEVARTFVADAPEPRLGTALGAAFAALGLVARARRRTTARAAVRS